MDLVLKSRISGFGSGLSVLSNGLNESWTRLFFIFCQIFAIFDDFLKWSTLKGAAKLWKIIENGKNLAKNEENPCSTCIQPGHFPNWFLVAKIWFLRPAWSITTNNSDLVCSKKKEMICTYFLFRVGIC